MSKLAYHFGLKVRFYPSDKQKQIIKKNYDTQRFVYNQYVGLNRLIYHTLKMSRIKQLTSSLPFVMSSMNLLEIQNAQTILKARYLLAKASNLRAEYSFCKPNSRIFRRP